MIRTFRLQRVLDHRRRLEREQQGVVVDARAATEAVRGALAAVEQDAARERARAARALMGPLDTRAAEGASAYRERLAETIVLRRVEVNAREAALRAAEAALLDRRRDRRALETLEEQHRERVLAADRHADAALMDEVAMARAARRAMGRERSVR